MKELPCGMARIRILSIDGGGLRGLAPLLVLQWIERNTGKRVHELFDVITGTSTGGIIACGLAGSADGVSPLLDLGQIIALYREEGATIFPPPENALGRFVRSIKSAFDPRYSPAGLDGLLRRNFGELKLSDTLVPIIVPSYDIGHNEVLMFKSRKAADPLYDCFLYEICRATSAAPTYLPSYPMRYPDRTGMVKNRVCIDGGIYLNNPTLAAVSDLIKHGHNGERVALEDISCLSLGTGIFIKELNEERSVDWGLFNWARPITDVMMQASSMSAVYESEQLIDHYLRLQFQIDRPEFSDMADARPETRAYWEERARAELLNAERQAALQAFFER